MNERLNGWQNVVAIVLAGLLIGVLGALFLSTLRLVDSARLSLIDVAVEHSIPSWLLAMIAASTGAAIAAWLTQRWARDAPQLSVSHNALTSHKSTSRLGAITVNFAGTSLAVGAGFAIGPERPAIQMGGAIGAIICRFVGVKHSDRKLLIAAAGGAGVATMFNSPMGCAAYTVESVLKRVDYRISMTTLGIGVIAVAVSRALIGRDVNYLVEQSPNVRFEHLALYLLLGCLMAVVASLHVHLIIFLTRVNENIKLSNMVRGAVIGAAIGLIAAFAPGVVGVGDILTQNVIDGNFALSAMLILFLIRFFLGPFSLVAGTPGGYFTPVLLLGALAGAMFGMLIEMWLPQHDLSITSFALVGMAVALASVAGAPFTGILLVMETTGSFELALPMIIAVIGSVMVTQLIRTPSLSHGLESILAISARHFR